MGKEATKSVNVDEVNHNYHIKVLILCFTCIVIYIYLYSSIAVKSEVLSIFVKDSIDDLEVLKYKLELLLKSQLNERTELTRNTRPNLSQNFNSTFPLLTIKRPSKTAIGIPILKYMYLDAMKTYRSKKCIR